MTITKKRMVGNLGEDLCCKYLVKCGFDILERNYYKKQGEVDIIARRLGKIHFVEVKSVSREISPNKTKNVTRETSGYRPEENVHPRKLAKIKKTIQIYLLEKKIPLSIEWAFEVATVLLDFKKRVGRVEIIKDIIL